MGVRVKTFFARRVGRSTTYLHGVSHSAQRKTQMGEADEPKSAGERFNIGPEVWFRAALSL